MNWIGISRKGPVVWNGLSNFTPQKWGFSLKISSVNVTKSVGDCGFGHIYWRYG